MAHEVLLPRQGNTVESCIILAWKKVEGERVSASDIVCEVETDKATFEVEAGADGTLLKHLVAEGDDVPVLTAIALVGAEGEAVEVTGAADSPDAAATLESTAGGPDSRPTAAPQVPAAPDAQAAPAAGSAADGARVSPRAKKLSGARGIDPSTLTGTGPEGRVIERDVIAAAAARPELTRAARELAQEGAPVPAQGTGAGGRVTAADVQAAARGTTATPNESVPGGRVDSAAVGVGGAAGTSKTGDRIDGERRDATYTEAPLSGIRRRIADRMVNSLQTTAQLTLNGWADAEPMLTYRARIKAVGAQLGLGAVTINDMVLFVVARALAQEPQINATLVDGVLRSYRVVNLGFAVDTERGLFVPVIRNAARLSLAELAGEARRLAEACRAGTITAEEMDGATFTVTNLGGYGVGHFTPVLNPPQTGILGVGAAELRPKMDSEGTVTHRRELPLSLTIDHRAIDGAPGARFLSTVSKAIGLFDMYLAG